MPRYMTSGMHKITGCNAIAINAVEKINRPHLAVLVGSTDIDTRTEVDNVIQFAKDIGATDLYVYIHDWSTPYKLMGYAGSCNLHLTAIRYDGMYPFDYLVKQCLPLGIKIHSWWTIYHWRNWGDTSYSFVNTRLADTYRDTTSSGGNTMVELNEPVARDFIQDVIADFALYNSQSGIHYDYVRADGYSDVHAHTDITAFVSELRDRLPGREISVDVVGRGYQEQTGANNINQRPRNWVASRDVDGVMLMSYDAFFGDRLKVFLDTQHVGQSYALAGFSYMANTDSLSEIANRIEQLQRQGVRHFCLFDTGQGSDSWMTASWKRLAQAINIKGDTKSLYPDMGRLSRITVNQGTSVVITVDSTVYTITWAEMGLTGETDPADLKSNAESAEGISLKPFCFDWRSSTSLLYFGTDWYDRGI